MKLKNGTIKLTLLLFFIFTNLLFNSNSNASLLTVEWEVEVNSQYNYLNGKYDDFEKITTFASISFDNIISHVNDYGTTTITTFGGFYGTSWTTPMIDRIGIDPFGLGLNTPRPTSYTFPNVSDYSSVFIEEAASQKNIYSPSNDGNQFWSYHVELRAERRSNSMGGTGTADYAFTPQSLLQFYKEFQNSNSTAYFNESYQLFDSQLGKSFGGYSWTGNARITNIIEDTVSVNAPSLIFIFISVFASFFVFCRRKGVTV